MMRELYNALPDDRPITSILVVEDPSKCPSGYSVIQRTYDQDSDADLWKEGFFGTKRTRYLCMSKSDGPPGYLVENISIIGDKEPPPEGFTVITHTRDSEQKAWRKKQICFRLTNSTDAIMTVTDIIVLSKSKKAPEGFTMIGEMHGLVLCCKTRIPSAINSARPKQTNLPYALTPEIPYSGSSGGSRNGYPPSNPQVPNGGIYPSLVPPPLPSRPARAAPLPPEKNLRNNNYTTLAVFTGLEGVPFTFSINVKEDSSDIFQVPQITAKSKAQIDREYNYDFRVERQAQQNI